MAPSSPSLASTFLGPSWSPPSGSKTLYYKPFLPTRLLKASQVSLALMLIAFAGFPETLELVRLTPKALCAPVATCSPAVETRVLERVEADLSRSVHKGVRLLGASFFLVGFCALLSQYMLTSHISHQLERDVMNFLVDYQNRLVNLKGIIDATAGRKQSDEEKAFIFCEKHELMASMLRYSQSKRLQSLFYCPLLAAVFIFSVAWTAVSAWALLLVLDENALEGTKTQLKTTTEIFSCLLQCELMSSPIGGGETTMMYGVLLILVNAVLLFVYVAFWKYHEHLTLFDLTFAQVGVRVRVFLGDGREEEKHEL